MATFLITTTGTPTTVVLGDLGARSFTHPETNYNLTDEYTMEDIRESVDLRTAIENAELTATLDGVPITSGALFDTIVEDFLNARVAQNETDITTLQGQIEALEKGGRRAKKVINVADSTAVPPTEVSGDRYWLDFSGAPNAAWDGVPQGAIAEFDGATWQDVSLEGGMQEGDVAYADATNSDWVYVDDGSPTLEERDGLLEQNATQVPYSPTTPADWDVTPTEAGGALDELAGRVENLENAPAPTTKKTWTYSAGEDGNISGDRDLQRTGSPTTNLTPFIIPVAGTIWGVTIASKQGVNATFDIQIIQNGSVAHTESVVTADKKVNAALSLPVVAGDEIRVRFIHQGANVRDVGVEVYGLES